MASAPFAIRVMAARRGRWRRTMGGYQVSGHGPGDDGYDEEGYDESQRAEILETTRTGPSDGPIMVDLDPDLGDDDDTDEEDDLLMPDDELGEESHDYREADVAIDEADAPDDFYSRNDAYDALAHRDEDALELFAST